MRVLCLKSEEEAKEWGEGEEGEKTRKLLDEETTEELDKRAYLYLLTRWNKITISLKEKKYLIVYPSPGASSCSAATPRLWRRTLRRSGRTSRRSGPSAWT